jgi:cell division protein FtsA
MGVLLVDLGGGTTDALVYCQGTPYATFSIPLGGSEITQDISMVKNISFENSERAKIEAQCCMAELLEKDDEIIIEGMGGRSPVAIPKSQIAMIVRPRLEEIFRLVKSRLDALPLNRRLGGGIVLTGGGAEFLGAVELAIRVFRMPVRIGVPFPLGGLREQYLSPLYATAVGLALEGNSQESGKRTDKGTDKGTKGKGSLLGRIGGWLKNELF